MGRGIILKGAPRFDQNPDEVPRFVQYPNGGIYFFLVQITLNNANYALYEYRIFQMEGRGQFVEMQKGRVGLLIFPKQKTEHPHLNF